MQVKQEEELVKIIIIGDCGVGKTNILHRFCENTFKNSYVATIGVDFKVKTLTVKNKRVKLQIWDTAGQERFKNIAQAYYRGAAGIILTYSITDNKSFENLQRWMIQINEHAPKDVIRVIVANKLDMDSERVVQEREGRALANKYDIPFIEVSAKNGEQVNQMFTIMATLLVEEYFPKKSAIDPKRYSLKSIKPEQQTSKQKCQC